MKPLLLLSIRAEPAAAEDEFDAFCRFLEVEPADVCRVQLGVDPLPVRTATDLGEWSSIVLGGGPYTWSDPEAKKSSEQISAEEQLRELLTLVIEHDFPFLGVCYGIGTLGSYLGGTVDRRHPEPVGPLSVSMTAHGHDDPVFADLPDDFLAYGGHKEALASLPPGATLLATSDACPVQAFRVGSNVYATQFHPELDLAGLFTRIEAYATYGYFHPDEIAELHRRAEAVEVTAPMTICRNFARLHVRAEPSG